MRIIKQKVKMDKGQRTVFVLYFFLYAVFTFLFLYPLFWCLQNSFKSVEAFYDNANALPKTWNFIYYKEIFKAFKVGNNGFWNLAWNSVWLSFGGQALALTASICVAYPLARYNFPFKGFFYGLIIFKITIPIIGAGPAYYKLLRLLNMINNPKLFMITFFSGFDLATLIMYSYFKGISKEYNEAAYLDGASRIKTLVKVILPQAYPCALALFISSVMSSWNNFTTPQIFFPKFPNLALAIYEYETSMLFIENGTAKFFGAVILSSLVPLTLFGIGQKFMVKNMSVGGLKG